jgi:DNA-binding transcriptional regulator YdaS (Cro superfamily)
MLAGLLQRRGIRLTDLARSVGVDKSSVTRWDKRRIPAERVLDVERVTGIPRHELRPDLYPSPEQQGAVS